MNHSSESTTCDALLMANILASREAEWELLGWNFDRIRPGRSSLIVDLWDSDLTATDVFRSHGPVIDRFDQVIFMKLGRREQQGRHLRSSLAYYRHWLCCLDLVQSDELPNHIIQLDARYQDAIDLDLAFSTLERSEVFAVTCYQDRINLSSEQIRIMAKAEAEDHGLPYEILSRDEDGYCVLGPWFSTRYFVFHKTRIPKFLNHLKEWPQVSCRRLEYHLCGLLSPRESLYVHDPE